MQVVAAELMFDSRSAWFTYPQKLNNAFVTESCRSCGSQLLTGHQNAALHYHVVNIIILLFENWLLDSKPYLKERRTYLLSQPEDAPLGIFSMNASTA